MASAKSAATRSGVGDTRKPASRLDGRAWREIDHACKIAKKNDAYSVEIRGVRVVFKLCGESTPEEPTGGKAPSTQASRQRSPPSRAMATRSTQVPNSAQRKSARRMQAHLLTMGAGSGNAAPKPIPADTAAAKPAQVEADVRMNDAETATDESGSRGTKRAASELPAQQAPSKSASSGRAVSRPIPAEPAVVQPAQVAHGMRKDCGTVAIADPAGREQTAAAGEPPVPAPITGARNAAPQVRRIESTHQAPQSPAAPVWPRPGKTRDWRCRGCGLQEPDRPRPRGVAGWPDLPAHICKCRDPMWYVHTAAMW